jgi:2-keto-4-pentenoate hydratase/2-oxohepta-3-ene-1,7-dioic acid hydratase in catechol pathway
VRDGGIVDLGRRFADRYPSLRTILAAGALEKLERTLEDSAAPNYGMEEVILLPPIPDPAKIVCVGLNYDEHRAETGREPTGHPVLFSRFADSQVGHGSPIVKPRNSDRLDYEGELAVVVGKAGRHVSRAEALGHVAGYACYDDASVRDFQAHTHQYLPGKNFPATGSFGPHIVTADEIPDPSELILTTRLNGEEVQRGSVAQMIFDVPRLISYISSFTNLRPGDVIATGTPGGVGFKRQPPLFLKDGDEVEVEISGIGVLRNPVVSER